MSVSIYHNPRWGKSRNSVRILEEENIDYKVIEYLKEPLDIKELKKILKILDLKAIDIIRKSEAEYKDNEIGKIMIDKPYTFGLIKVIEPNLDEFVNKELICGKSKIKILKPNWI